MEKSRVRRSAFVTLGFFLLFLFVVTSFPSSSAEIVNICGIWCCDTPGEVGGSCVKANTGGVCTLGDPMIPRGGNGPCPPLATCDPINLICVRDDSFVATSFGTCTQSPDPFPASCFVDITSWEDVRCGAPWITTDCGGFDVIDSGECLLTQMTQKTSTVISCPGPDVSTFEYQCVEDVSCEVVPEPGLWCCDDDDDDLWTGTDPVSSFLGTCTNLFTSGREKVCSDFSFAGSEGDACDDDVDRNPGVPEVCGNDIDENCDGVIEECDDNCGDTWKMGGEECDDGNTANGDGCSSTCELEPGYWCDHGWPSFNLWHCFTTRCGDGVQNPEEECDDGNRNSGDGCSYALCEIEAPECGDNTVDAGEECDDGNTANGDGCSSTCQLEGGANCGDTWVTGGEECDDGNTVNGDGCSSFCTEEPGWDCYHTDMWHTICTRCGDGVQNPEEECDDGNTNAWDDCSYPDCSLNPVCGNGVNEVGEQCDDGNTVSGDGCSSTCQIEAGGNCGDNIRDSPEEACDGSDLGGYVCADFGAYTGGPLSCHGPGAANECTFDFSGCINEPEARYYWTNMNGNEISEAQVGDTVRLVAEEVASGTFSIKEDDLVLDDDIRDVVGSGVGVDLVGVWTIGEDDLELASNNDGPLGEVGDYEFYFNLGGSMDSDILYVSPDEDDDPLVVFIEGVVCGSHFDEGSVSEITIVANDADDEIVGSVTIYGVTILFTNGGISFNQTFNSPGNVQILVEADTFAGDDRKRIISNVMVLDKASGSYVDGTYVAACIDKPADLSNIPGGLVEFDASSTRGVRVTGGAVDELIPGVDAFSWYWTFYPELIERNFVDSTESSAYIFEAVLPMAGTNTAELVVEVS